MEISFCNTRRAKHKILYKPTDFLDKKCIFPPQKIIEFI